MPRPQLAEFMRRMEPNSVAILPAAREATRSNDTEYRFRQDSDFYYLTGFSEPDAIAVVAPSREERYTLFVRPRDREKETWTGRRAGVEGAKEKFGADAAFPVEEFQEKLAEFLDGARNLYYRLGNGNPELDLTIVRQIASMRNRGWRNVHPPQAGADTGSILHGMRPFRCDEKCGLSHRR